MLEKLYELGYLNLEKLILDNYKELNINEKEAIILIEFTRSYTKYDGNVYEDKLASKLHLDTNEVSNIIARFLELNILDCSYIITNGVGQTHYSLTPLFEQIEKILSSSKENNENTVEIISYLESKLLRNLSSAEMDKVLLWKEDNITLEDVIKSVEKLTLSNTSITILKLEKSLYQTSRQTKQNNTKPKKSSISELLNL